MSSAHIFGGKGDEMVEGYLDGLDKDSVYPVCQGNRSEAYVHGFLNGRDDRNGNPRASAAELRVEANRIMTESNE